MVVFDLDPGPGKTLLDCIPIAEDLRRALAQFGLSAFAKTSGDKGLHVYVPLNTPATYDETKTFARALAQVIERQRPEAVTANMRKDLRPGKVFIDWSQNSDHKTTIAVYSLRARERPVVSTPVTWEELAGVLRLGNAAGLIFETDAVFERVSVHGDLFAPVLELQQHLPKL
jgi:bifunctional non-homologous end joining protein LigD